MGNKTALIILDGWGIGDRTKSDAIHHANTPFFDSLLKKYPHSTLTTYGPAVGLPEGQMGNSEVGHLNIGAGRIVFQELLRINNAVREGVLRTNETLQETFKIARQKDKPVHFIGLVSEGGVHSSQNHLHHLVDLATEVGLEKIYIHAFTDGRDTNPKNAKDCIGTLLQHIEGGPAKLVSLIGRYYAMDRDKRWERISKAYNLLVHGAGTPTTDFSDAVENSYSMGITDEFIEPLVIEGREGRISEGDVVICFNFRTDRCRQITTALTQQAFPEHQMQPLDLHYVTMTRYDESFRNVHVIFEKDNLYNTLGEVVARSGLKQLRIAETEKYPHVTFFFSGGREEAFEREERIMVNSPKVATYDLQPEMSAREVTAAVTEHIENHAPDFICLNFANPDMVGHTGVYEAIIKAVETTDNCLQKVVEKGLASGYQFVIIADHGNADKAFQENGVPHTAHTVNPVPCIVISDKVEQVKAGILADVAPTILALMKIPQPKEMTGRPLV